MVSFESLVNDLLTSLPNVVTALLLLLLAWVVARISRSIISKGLKKAGLHRAFVRARLAENDGKGEELLTTIGSIVYYLVFILFLPSILDALNMTAVSQPISDMMAKLLDFLPNLLIATIILVVGIIVARLVRTLVSNVLHGLNVDRLFDKLYAGEKERPAKETLASILSNTVMVIILIPVITVSLEALNIQTISEPIVSVLTSVLAILPNIFVAIILVIAGFYIAKFVSELLTSLLDRTGINRIYGALGFSEQKNVNLPSIIGYVVKVLILLFFVVEALNVLQLYVLNQIGNAIILYLPLLLSALVIILIGLLAGNLLQKTIRHYTGSTFSALIVKYVVIVFAIFMTLDQLGFASSIVNIAFLLILGGLAIAFAISFGIGGREFAKRRLEVFEEKITSSKGDSPSSSSDND